MNAPDRLTAAVCRVIETKLGHVVPHFYQERVDQGLREAQAILSARSPEAALAQLDRLPIDRPAWQAVIRSVTVGETNFMRHQEWFAEIKNLILRPLIENRQKHGPKRINLWSAACSTGEEPYTLALLIDELLPDRSGWTIRILGTDINEASLTRAREGIYRPWALREMASCLLAHNFSKVGPDRFQLSSRLRQMVDFKMLNLCTDAYPDAAKDFADFDLIICRNVLIYFTPAEQLAVTARLVRSLASSGWIAVSPAEATAQWYKPLKVVNRPGAIFFHDDADTAARNPRPHRQSKAKPKPDMLVNWTEPATVSPTRKMEPPVEGVLSRAHGHADRGEYQEARQLCEAHLAASGSDIDAYLLQEALEHKVKERTHQLQSEVVTRRQAELAADTARERLLDAIQSINDGFALYDAEDVLLGANSAYRDMHASIKDLIVPGVTFEDLVRAGLDCGDGRLTKSTDAQVKARVARHRDADGIPVIRGRDGTWVMSSDRRTHEGGVVVVETDITDLKKADIAKDEFLAKVSHELRTPLTPIHGALTLILSGKVAPIPDTLRDMVDMADRNCKRLMSIVNDLLDFTRISAGRFSLDPGVVDLNPFLDQVVQNKRIGQAPPDITLTVKPDAKNLKLEVDPMRIQQVLDNLLSNAMKFTKPGGHIEVEVARHNGSLRISVVDHGPGIPKEFEARMFEAFAQADSSSSRQLGGVGLGLSIAKSIVEAHGGQIGFQSKEGSGTTFFFDLPLATQDSG